jgi:hypothetical protein
VVQCFGAAIKAVPGCGFSRCGNSGAVHHEKATIRSQAQCNSECDLDGPEQTYQARARRAELLSEQATVQACLHSKGGSRVKAVYAPFVQPGAHGPTGSTFTARKALSANAGY